MKKKTSVLICLCNHFSTGANIEKFGAGIKKKNFKIIVLSILPIFSQNIYKLFYKKSKRQIRKNKDFIDILNLKHLFKVIKIFSSQKGFFVNYAEKNFISFFIEFYFCRLKRFKKIEIIDNNPMKFKQNHLKNFKKLFKIDKLFLFKKILIFLNQIFKRILISIFDQKTNIYFVDNNHDYLKLKKKRINPIKIDNYDYSNYLKNKNKKGKNKNHIIFLDCTLDNENNFDYSLRSHKISKFNSKKYWHNMEKFFTKLEKSTNNKYKVLIAAHPKRPSHNFPIKRKFIYNRTLELVNTSKLVLSHHSYSINFAVMCKKPILLLKSDDFDLSTFERNESIEFLQNKLNLQVINIAKEKMIEKKFISKIKIKQSSYKNFFENFIGFKENESFGQKWNIISSTLTS